MRKSVLSVTRRNISRQTYRVHENALDCSFRCSSCNGRQFTTTSFRTATALPITATGPPPSAPQPNPSQQSERIERKRKQLELLEKAKEIRQQQQQQSVQSPGSSPVAANSKQQSPLRRRFWKDVHVREVPEGYQILLDTRPVKTPSKSTLTIPKSKAHLAHAIAIEWDLLVSAQQALKNHNIPMTSIVSRAQDLAESEAVTEKNTGAVATATAGTTSVGHDVSEREKILRVLMRYLETDTLLCWAPERNIHEGLDMERTNNGGGSGGTESLRQQQIRIAKPIISYLNTSVWPGVEIQPALDENSILPRQQSEVTRSVISGWISGLPAYELAALERATLASKSLLVGARLLIEWSEEFRDIQGPARQERPRFGIEEAAEACSVEVRWQTGMWGEVEDTHDVEKEDVRRQLGAAVLVVSGAR